MRSAIVTESGLVVSEEELDAEDGLRHACAMGREVLDVAGKAVAANPESDQFQETLAATQFRAGKYDAVRELHLKIAQRDESSDASANSSPDKSWYFLALDDRYRR